MKISRRLALFGIGKTVAASVAVAAVPTPAVSTPAKVARYLTPAQYIQEMLAIEARPVAGFHYKLDGSIHPMGCYERFAEGFDDLPFEERRRREDLFLTIQRRSNWHDRAWADEVWNRLWALGRRGDKTPEKLRAKIAARAVAT